MSLKNPSNPSCSVLHFYRVMQQPLSQPVVLTGSLFVFSWTGIKLHTCDTGTSLMFSIKDRVLDFLKYIGVRDTSWLLWVEFVFHMPYYDISVCPDHSVFALWVLNLSTCINCVPWWFAILSSAFFRSMRTFNRTRIRTENERHRC